MKASLFISILVLLNLSVFGQADSIKLNLIFQPSTITGLTKTIEKIKIDKSSNIGNVRIKTEFKGLLSVNVYYHQFELSLIVPLKIDGHNYWGEASYILEILSQNDQIIFKRLSTNDGELKKFEFKESQLSKFLTAYGQIYSAKIELNYSKLKLYENEDFGVVCYLSGKLPDKGKEMMNLVNKKQSQELLNWVKAISPLTKAYGVLGLYILTKRGMKLKEEEKKLIALTRNQTIEINTCVGCMSGTKKSLNVLLTDKSLNDICKSLK